jgi:hypothetical protein
MDHLLPATGVANYVTTVLVPELAVLLVKEDMRARDQTARGKFFRRVRILGRHYTKTREAWCGILTCGLAFSNAGDVVGTSLASVSASPSVP